MRRYLHLLVKGGVFEKRGVYPSPVHLFCAAFSVPCQFLPWRFQKYLLKVGGVILEGKYGIVWWWWSCSRNVVGRRRIKILFLPCLLIYSRFSA